MQERGAELGLCSLQTKSLTRPELDNKRPKRPTETRLTNRLTKEQKGLWESMKERHQGRSSHEQGFIRRRYVLVKRNVNAEERAWCSLTIFYRKCYKQDVIADNNNFLDSEHANVKLNKKVCQLIDNSLSDALHSGRRSR